MLCKKEFKPYLDGKELIVDESLRIGLIQSVNGLAKGFFNESIKNIIIEDYSIIVSTHPIEIEDKINLNVICYSIAHKNTDADIITQGHNEIVKQFLNRYSYYDILNEGLDFFSKFNKRFSKILGDIIKDPQERLLTIF